MWWMLLVFLTHFFGYLVPPWLGLRPAPRRRPDLTSRLRGVTWSKVAFMVAVLVALFALLHFVEHGGKKIAKDEALAIGRTEVDFKPTGYQIRDPRTRHPTARLLGDVVLPPQGVRGGYFCTSPWS